MRKRLVSAFLCALLIFTAILTSCKSSENVAKESDSAAAGNIETSEITKADTRAAIPDDLPDENFDGYTFNISTRENALPLCEHMKDLVVEQESGDVLDDAVYKRNVTVEDRFNIKGNL